MEKVKEYSPNQRRAAAERGILHRWNAPAVSKVVHPVYGEIIVPHCSNLGAVQCAADVWGCDWLAIRGGKTVWVPPGTKAVPMPDITQLLDRGST